MDPSRSRTTPLSTRSTRPLGRHQRSRVPVDGIRVFGVDAALYGVGSGLDVLLLQCHGFPAGDTDLPLHHDVLNCALRR